MGERTTTLRPFTEIERKHLRWAWDRRLALGGVSALVGIGGRGKSALTVRLASDLSNGILPGDLKGKRTAVLLASAEDPAEEVTSWRLDATDADQAHVMTVQGSGANGTVKLPEDLPSLAQDVQGLKASGYDAVVLFIDPWRAHLGKDTNTNAEAEVRHVLNFLSALAHDTTSAVVLVDHPNKRSDFIDIATRMSGAGIYNGIRSVLVFGQDPEQPETASRIIAPAKGNWTAPTPSLRVTLTPHVISGQETVRLDWDSTAPAVTYQDVLEAESSKAGQDQHKWSKTAAAEYFLLGYLWDGFKDAADARKATQLVAEVSSKTVQRLTRGEAGQKLSALFVRREVKTGRWEWGLKDEEELDRHQF